MPCNITALAATEGITFFASLIKFNIAGYVFSLQGYFTISLKNLLKKEKAKFGTGNVTETITDHHQISPSTIIAELRNAVNKFAEGVPTTDDRTAIIIKRKL